MPDGDVVRDFAEAAGIPFVQTEKLLLDRNPSLLPEAQLFLTELASRVRGIGHKDRFIDTPGHKVMIRLLDLQFNGKGLRPARSDALAFFKKMHESNEHVRQSWFPEREELFSQDFSAYSDEATLPPSSERSIDVAMSVLVALLTRTGEESADPAAKRRRGLEKKRKMIKLRQKSRKSSLKEGLAVGKVKGQP